MKNRIVLAWLTAVLPFATLPWFTIARNQDDVPWWQSHLFFHVVYIPLTVAAAYVALSLSRASRSKAVVVLARIVAGLQLVALVGHCGELVAVLRDGGLDADQSTFDNSDHAVFGGFTPIVLMVSVPLVIAITVIALKRPRGTTDLRALDRS